MGAIWHPWEIFYLILKAAIDKNVIIVHNFDTFLSLLHKSVTKELCFLRQWNKYKIGMYCIINAMLQPVHKDEICVYYYFSWRSILVAWKKS